MTALRPCADCTTLVPITATRCPVHHTAANRRGGSRRVKGRYDASHVKLRKRLLRTRPWCAKCRGPFTADDPPELDHVVAWSRGGRSGVESNAQLLHRSCNRAKGDRDAQGR